MAGEPAAQPLRIFRNDLLERLSRAGPASLLAFWLPVAAVCLSFGVAGHLGWQRMLACTVLGMLFWSLFEYCMHRFGFHAPLKGRLGARLMFIIHGCHHVDPSDAMRNVMPLSLTIPVGLALFGIDWMLFEPATAAWVAGVVALSYLVYDVGHWRLHQRHGRTRLERFLRRHHMQHHFADDGRNFGVSSPLWDHVFGTFGRRTRQVGRGPG